MNLHLMTNEVTNGVVCLDGTPAGTLFSFVNITRSKPHPSLRPGFYYSAATVPESKNKWQVCTGLNVLCHD